MKIYNVDELPNDPVMGGVYSINSNNISAITHGFFKYPCKFIPHIPRWAIKKYLKQKDNLLDPFCGSGTSLVEGVLHGKQSYGIEIDAYGRLLAEVKTTPFTKKEIEGLKIGFDELIKKVNKDGKVIIPKIDNLDLWFKKDVAYSLGRIKYEIDQLKGRKKLKNFLYVCLASIVRKVSNADDGSPKPYVSSRFPKKNIEVIKAFSDVFEKYFKGISQLSENFSLGQASNIGNDARIIDTNVKFNLAVTSPPYINAFDYVRSLRLENLWLGLSTEDDLRNIKRKHVGTENLNRNISLIHTDFPSLNKIVKEIGEKDKKRANIVANFFLDMEVNMRSVYKHLNKNGIYCIVVGDSLIRQVEVPTHKILIEIAESLGYSLDILFSYIIKNRYLRFPRNGRGGFIKNDWVICLKK